MTVAITLEQCVLQDTIVKPLDGNFWNLRCTAVQEMEIPGE